MARHAARNGHASSVRSTTTIVLIRTNADDINAKPAPGPMYAEAGVALASSTITANAAVVGNLKRPL